MRRHCALQLLLLLVVAVFAGLTLAVESSKAASSSTPIASPTPTTAITLRPSASIQPAVLAYVGRVCRFCTPERSARASVQSPLGSAQWPSRAHRLGVNAPGTLDPKTTCHMQCSIDSLSTFSSHEQQRHHDGRR